jgi:hypothetical protein
MWLRHAWRRRGHGGEAVSLLPKRSDEMVGSAIGARVPTASPRAQAGPVPQGWSARATGIHAHDDIPPRDAAVKTMVLTTWVPQSSEGRRTRPSV